MRNSRVAQYQAQLKALADRMRLNVEEIEEQVRMPTGGQDDGSLSSTPLHLGDLGTEAFIQELNATLLENEEYIREEVVAALARIDEGTFGDCERCGGQIMAQRLKVLPYTRYCTACAAQLGTGPVGTGVDVNLNAGRPRTAADTLSPHDEDPQIRRDDGSHELQGEHDRTDSFAAGSAGGGTAVGGLAGTNLGDGDPVDADLEGAMGNGRLDSDAEENADEPYAGPSGGAVGGTPAGKRSVGGKTGRGFSPGS